jgi:uncharacterized protein
MIIEIQKISAEGSTYQGELAPAILDLENDKFIQAHKPVQYDLRAEIVTDQVLVSGQIRTELDLLCVACAEFFSTIVQVSSFLRAYSIQSNLETIDLTDEIREEILLAVPYYPRGEVDEHERCKRCGRDTKQIGNVSPPADSPEIWDTLNRLQL